MRLLCLFAPAGREQKQPNAAQMLESAQAKLYCCSAAALQDLTKKSGPTSCRSGGVVHLLAANGTKIPVTLKMSVREAQHSSGGMMHVIQVSCRSSNLASSCSTLPGVTHLRQLGTPSRSSLGFAQSRQWESLQMPAHHVVATCALASNSWSGLLILQVTRASEKQRLDQACLLLRLNHKGTILEVNAGVNSLNGSSDPLPHL